MERDALLDTVLESDTDMVADLTQCAYEYGRLKERAYNLRDFIIDNVGDKNWHNALIVYHAIYDVDCDALS